MEKRNRILMAVAALLLVGVYVFPIWSISMDAPQYPEGIGMNIRVNTIEGKSPHDLQNINGLNHYIGMKEIVPEAIPELKIMPYLFGFMLLSGLAIAWKGRRRHIFWWIVLFIAIALAGLVDFYLWEYDYGHNLNPNAAIKVPGMSYQPPLIGTKQLLNMKTTSMPHIGFYLTLVSMGLAGWIWWTGRSAAPAGKQQKHTATVTAAA